jgi:glycerol-3-phosphate dehydrogenase
MGVEVFMYDVLIIGGGVCGTLILRELSRYKLRLLLLDKENDIANGATMANSAIIHAGFDPKPGTLKAKLNLQGNLLYKNLCGELDILYKSLPSLVVAFSDEELNTVESLYQRGKGYGVPELSVISRDKLRAIEPNVSCNAAGALLAKSSAIVEPWSVGICAAENAVDNGAEVLLHKLVIAIEKSGDSFIVHTSDGNEYKSKIVINASGVGAEKIHNMICAPSFKINGRKGHYFVLDKQAKDLVQNIFFPCPNEKGKGILITPVIHNKVMIGPDSDFVTDAEDNGTETAGLLRIKEMSSKYLNIDLPLNLTIRSFAGVRPSSDTGDFIIKEDADIKGFIDVSGIDSPGLASAPAIAVYAKDITLGILGDVQINEKFNPIRRPQIRFSRLSKEDQMELTQKDHRYAHIVCRCEKITEAEIVDCIHRSCGAKTIKAVKKRAGAGFGRCQSGFCGPVVLDIVSRELGIEKQEVLYDKDGSNILYSSQ